MANKLLESITIDGVTMNIDSVSKGEAFYTNFPSRSIPNNTQTKVDVFEFPSDGILIASVFVGYVTNPNGGRWADMYYTLDSTPTTYSSMALSQRARALTGVQTWMTVPIVEQRMEIWKINKLAVNLFQDSGSTLNASVTIRGYFIPLNND